MSENSIAAQHGTVHLKSDGSGMWDKIPIILSALNPVLLVGIGYFLNAGIERTKVEIEQTKVQIEANSAGLRDLKTAAETSTIAVHDRVDKVKVISDFLNDLSGPDERRRSLAIEAIFIALPDEAARLVKVVERFAAKSGEPAENKDVAAAKDALATTRDRLVADMFSVVRPTRLEALSTLERGWTNDAPVVDMLITRAKSDVKARQATNWAKPADDKSYQQLASIYNVVEFLSVFRAPVDAAQKARIAEFLAAVAANSDDTRRTVVAIKDRFQ
jgi:hypothetical protein